MNEITRPTHDYVGRKAECGCPVMFIADVPEWKAETAEAIEEEKRKGLIFERVPRGEELSALLEKHIYDPCNHGQLRMKL